MYKKVSPLPEELTLVLNYKDKEVNIVFDEPTIYNVYLIEKLLNKWKYLEILELLKIPIKQDIFLSNPIWIIKGILKLINKNEDKTDEDNKFFLFSVFDKLSEKYSKSPIELMQMYTPSQISKIAEGIDFNKNKDDNKDYKNDKYFSEEYINEKEKKNNDILKRVYEAKEKLGLT